MNVRDRAGEIGCPPLPFVVLYVIIVLPAHLPCPIPSPPAPAPSRLGEFQAARSVVDAVLDRLSPSSQHFQDVRKKIREVDDVAQQLGHLREQVGLIGGLTN